MGPYPLCPFQNSGGFWGGQTPTRIPGITLLILNMTLGRLWVMFHNSILSVCRDHVYKNRFKTIKRDHWKLSPNRLRCEQSPRCWLCLCLRQASSWETVTMEREPGLCRPTSWNQILAPLISSSVTLSKYLNLSVSQVSIYGRGMEIVLALHG